MSARLICGDAIEELRALDAASLHAVVTDPPAGISFMGREWDSDRGGRAAWIAWLASVLSECLRICKPGAHALVWALPRTSHWTGMALEDAGWEVRDCLTHHFGSGFPKSLDVSKAIDRAAGATREVVGVRDGHANRAPRAMSPDGNGRRKTVRHDMETTPATPAAQEWSGFGTALKPATEFWWLARKPLSEPSVASNVLKWGCGALNIGACRVGRAAGDVPGWHKSGADGTGGYQGTGTFRTREMSAEEIAERCGGGRWPPNLVLTHSHDCRLKGARRVRGTATRDHCGERHTGAPMQFRESLRDDVHAGFADANGMEQVEDWACVADCPVAELDRQSGTLTSGARSGVYPRSNGVVSLGLKAGTGDWEASAGGASRFFPTFRYQAKPDKSERTTEGAVHNHHPTVKSVELMRWFVRLVTPPGGTVLDCFCGTGSTGLACEREGFDFLGIDQNAEYVEMARKRLVRDAGLFAEVSG